MKKDKERLDKLLLERGLAADLTRAQGLIMAGEVLVNGERVDKPGTPAARDAVIDLHAKSPFVGRGALKLEGALGKFQVPVQGRVCADVGSSTGGFTDVLLQRGAAKVYAIDTAYGELAWKLRADPRVVVMERTNACYLESLPEEIDMAVVDVSLVPLKNVLPAVVKWLKPEGDIIALLKPHYEARPEQLPPGAVIKDAAVRDEILADFLKWVDAVPLFPHGVMPSPITGSGGNVEFLLWLRREAAAQAGGLRT